MLKAHLLPSLVIMSDTVVLQPVREAFEGCQRTTCNGVRIQKNFFMRKCIDKLPGSRARLPGTKTAISPEWNRLSIPNF